MISKIKKIPILGALLSRAYRSFNKKNHSFDSPTIWLNKLLKGKNVQIVQIGSNDGKTGDPIFNLIKTNNPWKALFVEPIPYLFERLKINYGNDTRFIFENVAINDGTKQIFYAVKEEAKTYLPDLPSWYDQLGSFNKENILNHLNGALEPYIEEILLIGSTLTDLLKRNKINDIALLHIDAEGYDWKILSQLDLNYIKPKIILVEHKHLTDTEEKSMIHFLSKDYLLFKLGDDLIGILNNPSNKRAIIKLKGEPIG